MKHARLRPVERLVDRLRTDGWDIPDGYRFVRLYHGHWQRSAGALSWTIVAPSGFEVVGSCEPVTALLKAKVLARYVSAGGVEVMSDDPPGGDMTPVLKA